MTLEREEGEAREGGREGGRERETLIHCLPTGDQTCNLGTCPDQEPTTFQGTGLRSNQPHRLARAKLNGFKDFQRVY